MRLSDPQLRELVILRRRLMQADLAFMELCKFLKVDYRAASVSAMRASLREKSAKKKDPEAQPPLPF